MISRTTGRDKAIMAIDQGTTSSRAIVFDRTGAVRGAAQEEITQHFPQPGWVEHEPDEIWETQLRSCRTALERAGLDAADLAAIGIANQRETVLLWDAETGSSLGNAIVWQCRRAAERCSQLEQSGLGATIAARTGLRLDPYFSSTKIEWLLANRPGAAELLAKGRLRAGTIDSFLTWRLTGGRQHVTDFSNASRTMLLDLERLEWAADLLEIFHIPEKILPRLCPSSGVVGQTEPEWLGTAVPIAGMAGDQQAALFGHNAIRAGDAKNTYGTGCFLLMNVGPRPALPQDGLLSTVAWVLGRTAPETKVGRSGDEGVTYALEGSVFTAGGAVQWLRDGLRIIDRSSDVGPLAATTPDNGGVYFVPALTGMGAPYWDPYARGLLIGLTRGTTHAHIARATEEAVCFQSRAVLESMRRSSGFAITALHADGGAADDDFLLQLQADFLGMPVVRPRVRETTALGAAALAGLAVGFWSPGEIARLAGSDQTFVPHLAIQERERLYAEWERAVERALHWAR